MARRTGIVIPNIMDIVRRLVRFGILADKDWNLDWSDLTETSQEAKIALADKMADVNQKMKDTGEFVFTTEEMRGVTGREPLKDGEKYRDEQPDPDEEQDALDLPETEDEPAPAA